MFSRKKEPQTSKVVKSALRLLSSNPRLQALRTWPVAESEAIRIYYLVDKDTYLLLRGFGGSGISMKSYPPGVAPPTAAVIAPLYCRTTGQILEPRTTKASFRPARFC